jgi:hypothetical protein
MPAGIAHGREPVQSMLKREPSGVSRGCRSLAGRRAEAIGQRVTLG